jgi:hypothetical protein
VGQEFSHGFLEDKRLMFSLQTSAGHQWRHPRGQWPSSPGRLCKRLGVKLGDVRWKYQKEMPKGWKFIELAWINMD